MLTTLAYLYARTIGLFVSEYSTSSSCRRSWPFTSNTVMSYWLDDHWALATNWSGPCIPPKKTPAEKVLLSGPTMEGSKSASLPVRNPVKHWTIFIKISLLAETQSFLTPPPSYLHEFFWTRFLCGPGQTCRGNPSEEQAAWSHHTHWDLTGEQRQDFHSLTKKHKQNKNIFCLILILLCHCQIIQTWKTCSRFWTHLKTRWLRNVSMSTEAQCNRIKASCSNTADNSSCTKLPP